MRATILGVILTSSVAHAAAVDIPLEDHFIYRDWVASLEGARLTLGEYSHYDADGFWLDVPRVIPGEIAGPGTVISSAFNGLSADPGWTTIEATGSLQTLEAAPRTAGNNAAYLERGPRGLR